MHVMHAVNHGFQQSHYIAITHECVAGVKQEAHLCRISHVHQANRFFLRLHNRSQVMVIDQFKAVLVRNIAKHVQPFSQLHPLLIV